MESLSIQVKDAVVVGSAAPFQVHYHIQYSLGDGSEFWAQRTHMECESLHVMVLETMKGQDLEAPTIPAVSEMAKPRASDLSYLMNYYFVALASVSPIRATLLGFLQDACVKMEPSKYLSSASGTLSLWDPATKTWSKKYGVIHTGCLSLFPSILERIDVETKAESEITLRNVSYVEMPKVKPSDEYYVPDAKQYLFSIENNATTHLFSVGSRTSRKDWMADLHQNSLAKRARRMSIKRKLTEETKEALEEMKRILFGDEVPPEVSENALLRFLEDRDCDPKRGAALFFDDMLWRRNMDLENLTACSAGEWMRKGKVFVPGSYDKQGRPIIVFRARLHDPSVDTFDTIKLGVYALERACELMKDNSEVIMIEDLTGFSRSQADNRIAKLFLELVQAHYPGRLGGFYAVNAPWYYRLLFKVVKPWLSLELQNKVHILGGTDELLEFVEKDQLIPELGGTFPFELEDYLEERARVEGVPLDGPDRHQPREEVLALYCDRSVEQTVKGCALRGWTKKQGGFVKNFNKRYCVLTRTMLYYYRGTDDDKAEGMLPLRGARVDDTSDTTFTVVVAQKDGVFSCSSMKEKDEWVDAIRKQISALAAECGGLSLARVPSSSSVASLRSSSSSGTLSESGTFIAGAGPASAYTERKFLSPTFSLHFDGDESEDTLPRLSAALARASALGDTTAAAVRYHQTLEVAWTMQTNKDRMSLPATGETFLAWLTVNGHSKEEALSLLGDMLTFGVIVPFTGSRNSSPTSSPLRPDHTPQSLLASHTFCKQTEYVFLERFPTPVLNARFLWLSEAKPVTELLAELFLHVRGLVQKYKKDGIVDIHRLRKKAPFRNFTIATAALQRVAIADIPADQLTPFLLALFHLLAVHSTLMLDNVPMRSGRWKTENSIAYRLADCTLSLTDIECGLLRGNRAPPGAVGGSHWPDNHPLAPVAQKITFDPRVHFFINAGAFARDVLDIDWLSWEDVDGSLARAAKEFVEADLCVRGNIISVCSMFREFQDDFGESERGMLSFVAQFASDAKRAEMEKALGGQYHVAYTTYRKIRVGAGYLNN